MSTVDSFGRRVFAAALGTGELRRGASRRGVRPRGVSRRHYEPWRRCLAALLRVDLPAAPYAGTPAISRAGGHGVLRPLALFVVLLGGPALIGSVLGRAGAIVGLLAGLTGVLYAYRSSDRLALRAMRARQADESEAPQLFQIVRELSEAAGQPMPDIYVSPTPAPNAFVVGRSRRNAAVCCTEGLLYVLSERELRGVLGHELSHIHNRDSLISSMVGTLAGMVLFLASILWMRPRSEDEDALGLAGTLLIVLLGGPFAASLIRLAVSRSREIEADSCGAALTGDPLALASALRKIDSGTRRLPLPVEPGLQVRAHMMIADPFRSETAVSRLFSSHAPMPERIARLERLAAD
ncbi:M48 family metalloprotease, partial [Streptomyces sp. FH025]|uniref:M48 family metalloprotease n=1 Tax=Streptomyces sp. FH025 TaxID=2815937 RepID=UPI001A9EEB92